MKHGSRQRDCSRIGRLCLGATATAICAIVVSAPATAAPDVALHGKVVVGKTGNGEGRITSTPGGIDCGPRCSFSFVSTDDPVNYQPVTLKATPEPGSAFEGFGECGEDTCTIDPVEPGQTYEVNVSFVRVKPSQFPLTVAVAGQGRITSSPDGIDCGPKCSASFPTDSTVSLTATAVPGWSFSGWDGACGGTGPCAVTMSNPRSVTATFAPPNTVYPLAVAAAGGSVLSNVPGIDCGESCVGSYGAGVDVTLTPSSYPVKWGGACSGGGACVVPMTRARAVTASIGGAKLTRVPLAVGFTGEGSIVSVPPGISCAATCGSLFSAGTRITLRASPAKGWLLAGWSGSCHGLASSCVATARGAFAATAAFVKSGTRFPVAVTKVGRGTVTSRPAGINCGSACSHSFTAGTAVTIEAVAKKGWTFVRWSGACEGRKHACVLDMDGAKSVSATFGQVADPTSPRVTALASVGERGKIARLRYRVVEASDRSREIATVFRGSRRLATITGVWHAVEPDTLFYFLSWRSPVSGDLRFCVSSTDPTGNRSKPSCARLRIT